MSDSLLVTLEPEVQPLAAELMRVARTRFPKAVVASGRRTCAEQNAIYAKGRTVPGAIVSNARGCMSWHVQGRAFDVNLGKGAKTSDYAWLGAEWVKLGGKWGGDFADYGHFEYHPGLTIEAVCPNPDDCRNTAAPMFYGFPGLAAKSPEFRCELWKVGKRLGVDPNWLAAVIYSESGFDSKVRNAWCMKNSPSAPDGCAVGLIQFMPVGAKAVGTTTRALYEMSDVEQLAYVEKFYQPRRSKLKRPVDVYMATFLPAFVGADGEKVLGRKGDTSSLGYGLALSAMYEQNSGFDSAKRGYFTVNDVGARVDSILAAAAKKPPVTVDCTTPPKGQAAPAVPSSSYSESGPLPTLQRGQRGAAVRVWQRILGLVEVDGLFGLNTERATKLWQKSRGLVQTGVVDEKTWEEVP